MRFLLQVALTATVFLLRAGAVGAQGADGEPGAAVPGPAPAETTAVPGLLAVPFAPAPAGGAAGLRDTVATRGRPRARLAGGRAGGG